MLIALVSHIFIGHVSVLELGPIDIACVRINLYLRELSKSQRAAPRLNIVFKEVIYLHL